MDTADKVLIRLMLDRLPLHEILQEIADEHAHRARVMMLNQAKRPHAGALVVQAAKLAALAAECHYVSP